MSKKCFVGNIDWALTQAELEELFAKYGELATREDGSSDVVIITDKFSGRSRGFGFVTFVNDEDAEKAMTELDGYELNGRPLAVKEAMERKDRDDRDYRPSDNAETKEDTKETEEA